MDPRAGLPRRYSALHYGDGAAQGNWTRTTERFSRTGADHLQPRCADRYWISDGGSAHAPAQPAGRGHAGREAALDAISAKKLVLPEALVGTIAVCTDRGVLQRVLAAATVQVS